MAGDQGPGALPCEIRTWDDDPFVVISSPFQCTLFTCYLLNLVWDENTLFHVCNRYYYETVGAGAVPPARGRMIGIWQEEDERVPEREYRQHPSPFLLLSFRTFFPRLFLELRNLFSHSFLLIA